MSSFHTIKADNFKVSTDGTIFGLETGKKWKNFLRGDWKAELTQESESVAAVAEG